jgi:hypothetical protein
MGVAAVLVYKGCSLILGAGFVMNLVSTLAAILVAVIVYFVAVFGLHILTVDEIVQLPAGRKIYSVLQKLHFYSAK